MTTRRLLLAGIAGILTLTGLALALVYLASVGGGNAHPRADAPLREEPVPSPVPGSPAMGASSPSPIVQPAAIPGWTPPPAPRQTPLPPPAGDSWEATPIVARASSLGRIGVGMAQALQELEPSVAECFDEDVQARHGRLGVAQVEQATAEEAGIPVLVLELEGQREAVRVADAPVEARGGASDGLIACAQAALRGRTLEVPGALPGQRYRLRYPLSP